ncbi:MAG: 16S rRNA (uracil(1498)-N(3))-methyltransferase [Chitinispirillaceae bacterium]|nr:16S rRNA (uracil(1498)-N(3))-methyltransferase [Chitinispirillaceae bacterium]
MQIVTGQSGNRSRHTFFFTEDLTVDRAALDPAETKHAVSVLRLKPEDPLQLTDGRGRRAVGMYQTVIERKMRVQIIERTTMERRPPFINLFTGLPDRDAFEEILLDATALGVVRIVSVAAEYCQKKWWVDWEKLIPRFHRKMIVALKQSHSCWLPELATPCSTADAAASAAGTVLVADPQGEPLNAVMPIDPAVPLSCFIGPPGGFSEKELQLFDRSSIRVRIAPARLRTELAATVLCAQLIGLTV